MARAKIQEVPLCPECKKPTHRRCIETSPSQNGNGKTTTAYWQCLKCETYYFTSVNLDKP